MGWAVQVSRAEHGQAIESLQAVCGQCAGTYTVCHRLDDTSALLQDTQHVQLSWRKRHQQLDHKKKDCQAPGPKKLPHLRSAVDKGCQLPNDTHQLREKLPAGTQDHTSNARNQPLRFRTGLAATATAADVATGGVWRGSLVHTAASIAVRTCL